MRFNQCSPGKPFCGCEIHCPACVGSSEERDRSVRTANLLRVYLLWLIPLLLVACVRTNPPEGGSSSCGGGGTSPASSRATPPDVKSLEELVSGSNLVVIGTVLHVFPCEPNPENGRYV